MPGKSRWCRKPFGLVKINDPAAPPADSSYGLISPISMTASRREKIEALLASEPNDPFLRYGLAVEYDNEERPDDALRVFAGLIADAPPHVASFFRGAQLLARLDRIDEARDWLRRGIDEARRQGDLHAAGEMGELLANLGQLGE
jgi:tetratricopeptide (TPR) repeat protein